MWQWDSLSCCVPWLPVRPSFSQQMEVFYHFAGILSERGHKVLLTSSSFIFCQYGLSPVCHYVFTQSSTAADHTAWRRYRDAASLLFVVPLVTNRTETLFQTHNINWHSAGVQEDAEEQSHRVLLWSDRHGWSKYCIKGGGGLIETILTFHWSGGLCLYAIV